MAKISRWYTEDQVIELNLQEMLEVIEKAALASPGVLDTVPERYTTENPDFKNDEYYHINMSFPIKFSDVTISFLNDDGKFNPDKFQSSNFINALKEKTAEFYIKNAIPKNVREYIFSALNKSDDTTSSEEEKAIEVYNTIADNAFVTEKFFIDTGDKKKGSLIYFQCLILLTEQNIEDMADIANVANDETQSPNIEPESDVNEQWQLGPLNFFEHIGYYYNNISPSGDISYDHFRSVEKCLSICNKLNVKNRGSSGKYIVDFSFLKAEIRDLYSKIAQMLPFASLEEGLVDADGKAILLQDIEITYYFKYTYDPDTFESTTVALKPNGPCFDLLINEKAASKYAFPNESLEVAYINSFTGFMDQTYSDNALHLWANIDRVDSYFKKTEEADFDLDYFIKEFIFRYKERPEVKESVKVYNDGKANYKTKDAVEQERTGVTNTQKAEVFKKVREKTIQTSDQAFINIIKSAKTKWTVKDIYDQILNVVPLTELITTAAECMLKHINVNPARKVCQTVIKALKIEEIDRILEYINTSSSEQAGRLKDYLLDQGFDITPGFTSKKQEIKIALRQLSDQAITDDDFLCAVIFAAVPAALALLTLFGSSDELAGIDKKILEETDKFIKKELINPASEILNRVEKGLKNHKFLSFTEDWKKQLVDLLIEVIQQVIVELMSYLIREIAYLCDGSSKSDFANMVDTASDDFSNLDFLSDTITPFDFTPQDIVTDDGVYDEIKDLLDGYGGEDEITSDLIEDFIAAIFDLLTISEICSIVGEDGSDFNYNIIINKIWTGLLSLEKFKTIKQTLRTKNNLTLLFSIFANKIDASVCLEKLEKLENTKKVLSEICLNTSNSALVRDLQDKASDSAIESLLNQEDSIFDDLISAIHDLKNPEKAAGSPVVFCGPEAERAGATPLIPSMQHSSITYLDQQFLKTSLSGSVALFESNLNSFKSIMMNLEGISDPSDILNKINNASGNVVGAMATSYGLGGDGSGVTLRPGEEPLKKDQLDQKVASNAKIASSVQAALLSLLSVNVSQVNQEEETVTLGTSVNDDLIQLKYDFPNEKITLGITNEITGQKIENATGLTNINYQTIRDIVQANSTNTSNVVDNAVFNQLDLDFYGNLNAQIIKEHAEFVSAQDLFTTARFDQLKLNRKNLCEQSIFIIQDIIEDAKNNIEAIECKYGLGATPTARELGQIYAAIVAYIRVITANEMLKSIFVFASFSIDALLPSPEEQDASFYFQYIVQQVTARIMTSTEGQFLFNLENYMVLVYSAIENIETVAAQQVYEAIIGKSIAKIQSKFKQRLENAGYDTAIGALEQEYTEDIPYKQVYSNLDSFIGNGYFDHDPDLPVKFNSKELFVDITAESNTVVTPNFTRYHNFNSSRLKNGGFFVEYGVDFRRMYKGDTNAVYTEELHQLILDELNKTELALFGEDGEPSTYYPSSAPNSDYMPDGWLLPPRVKTISDYGTQLGVYNLADVYTYNIKFGSLKFLFGTKAVGPENELKAAFQVKNTFTEFTSDQISNLAAQEGTSGVIGFNFDKMFDALEELRTFLETNLDTTGDTYTQLKNVTGPQGIFSKNVFFNRLHQYAAYNLLLRVDGNPQLQALHEDFKNKYAFTPVSSEGLSVLDVAAGINAPVVKSMVFDKNYFIRSEGILYFKLPLLYFRRRPGDASPSTIGGISTTDSPDFSITSNLREAYNASRFEGLTINTITKELRNIVYKDQNFKTLINNIQYKNILSFVTILVTELVQRDYPLLNSAFDTTLLNLRSNIDQLVNIANRNNDPDFYQKFPANGLQDPNQQFNLDLVSLFLNALLKGLANTVDPTWVTPWLFPGPLTPIGVIAKILDGGSSGGTGNETSQLSEKINQQQVKNAIQNDLECNDD